ncbi:MAG: NAD(P) transhydrogenase subunit alpha [Firmicutes bacterium]|nr:NAD(P) transhydrogenase subunit alpha [Bacillota bacterium]
MEWILIGVFLTASIVGYLIIKQVPSLLHTPLMSGMNALSGITILAALLAAAGADKTLVLIVALLAAALAMVNISGGYFITHRMLRMFNKKEKVGKAE